MKTERKAKRSLRAPLIRNIYDIFIIYNTNINRERYRENFHLRFIFPAPRLSFPGIRVNANPKFTQVSSVCKHGEGWRRVDFIRARRSETDRPRKIWMGIGKIVIKIFPREGDLFSGKASRFVTLHHGDTVFLRKNLNIFLFFVFHFHHTLHTVSLCILLKRTHSNEKDYVPYKNVYVCEWNV